MNNSKPITVKDVADYIRISLEPDDIDEDISGVIFRDAYFTSIDRRVLGKLLDYTAPYTRWNVKKAEYIRDDRFILHMKQSLGEDGYWKRLDALVREYTIKSSHKTRENIGNTRAFLLGKAYLLKVQRVADENGLKGEEYYQWVNTYVTIFKEDVLKDLGEHATDQVQGLLQRIFHDI